ncbi:MAG: ABC transporter permease [Ktedonobacteraceae bacterium]|nr:ABC transporter permease [Ktedonobacteraceae bacterium]MBV9709832.1 ABC transporter permease [Ktedonobacteraceae bacterium]
MEQTTKRPSTLGQLILTNLRELVRDPMNFFFVLIFPFMFILIFLFISLLMKKDTTLEMGLVVPDSPSAQVQFLVDRLEHTPDLKVVRGSEAWHRDQLHKGQEQVVLVLPAALNDQATLRILNTSAGAAQSATLRSIIVEATRPASGPAVTTQLIGSQQSFDPAHYSLPGILVMAFLTLGLFGTAVPLITMRQRGTLRLLGLTPLSPLTFAGAQIIARFLLAVGQLTIVLAISYFALGKFPLANLPGILLSALLGILMILAMGYILGEIIPSPEAAGGLIGGLMTPILLLTGIMLPLSIMPSIFLTMAKFIPFTYLGDALRQQMTGSDLPIAPVVIDNLVILGVTVVLVALAVPLFRWGQPEAKATRRSKGSSAVLQHS